MSPNLSENSPSNYKRVGVVYNPSSRGGQAQTLFKAVVLPLLERFFGDRLVKCMPTQCRDDGTRCAFQLIVEDHCDYIISAGGDGSTFNVLNGLVRGCLYLDQDNKTRQSLMMTTNSGSSSHSPLPVAFAVLPIGSGNDLHKTLGVDVNVSDLKFFEKYIHMLAEGGEVIHADIGRVEYTKDHTGVIEETVNDEHIPTQYRENKACQLDSHDKGVRFYMNESSFGISTSILNAVNNSSISKEINYNIQTFWKQLTYVNPSVKVEVDGKVVKDGISQLVCVGNGKCFGGGMRINPNASITSEAFDVCVLHNLRLWNVPYIFYQIQYGTHGNNPLASLYERVKTIKASKNPETIDDVYLECDGEVVGKLPATYTIMPSCVKFVVPKNSIEHSNFMNK
ncbi:hypothetical protein C9374_013954 [Naegleria lovaniensis]|uniref:DAGKc domain-containing protein n=1 Tax=Naegleria lovaniensis TaxID=51637 RepID=A0AA88KPQ7_NAELO|nr:uncharacterized protein C9374_013954 [Naegleria lovaniensis]KAG2389394.1 hypothetical protein C9374_013954 [Naegleria lovaniensis]